VHVQTLWWRILARWEMNLFTGCTFTVFVAAVFTVAVLTAVAFVVVAFTTDVVAVVAGRLVYAESTTFFRGVLSWSASVVRPSWRSGSRRGRFCVGVRT